ncbi:MAG: hypothetical protein ACLQQ4_10520 [Bacteroidia bacterium]
MKTDKIGKIIKRLQPHLEQDDETKIANLAMVRKQAVHHVFHGKHTLVKNPDILKILSETLIYLKNKPNYQVELRKKLKGF